MDCARTPRRSPAAAGESPGVTVAVDVPSGVDADTGAVEGIAFPAMHTVTFGAVKLGLVVGEGRGYAGQVHLVDIGLGPYLPRATAVQLADADVAARLPLPSATDDKYSQGVVGIVAGSAAYPGPACSARVPRCAPARASSGTPEPRPTASGRPGRRRSSPTGGLRTPAGCRPGSSVRAWARTTTRASVLAEVLATDLPVIVDADGLTMLADDAAAVRDRTAPTLLTPARPGVRPLRVGRRCRPGRCGPPASPPSWAAPSCSRGRRPSSPTRDGTAFVNAHRHPVAGHGGHRRRPVGNRRARSWPTGPAGRRGRRGRRPPARPGGQLAAERGPLLAGDLVRRLPDAVGRVRGVPRRRLEDSEA